MKDRKPSGQRGRMVLYVANYLKQRYYRDIRAGATGFDPPEAVPTPKGEVAPDVSFVSRTKGRCLLAVETPASLGNGAGERLSALAAHASCSDAKLWVVVPRGSRARAEEKLQDLGVTAGIWELK